MVGDMKNKTELEYCIKRLEVRPWIIHNHVHTKLNDGKESISVKFQKVKSI